MSRVSVVIPTFRRAARLPDLVRALEAQTLPARDFDVVLVDDASGDDTAEVLSSLVAGARIDLRVITQKQNRGPGAARNAGWRSSHAPIIAFTDDDCVPAPRWLEAALEIFDHSSADIVQGRTVPDPTVPPRRWAKTLRIERLSNLYESCNVFYRARALEAAGGFDETITVPFGEDTAVGWAARRLGAITAFAPEALVFHSVTNPGFRYWWRYALMHRNFPLLVRRFPEMRRELLWLQLFMWRDRAVFDAAIAGVIGGVMWWPAFSLSLPYVYLRRPRGLSLQELKGAASQVAMDAAILAGLAIGSIRERTLVL